MSRCRSLALALALLAFVGLCASQSSAQNAARYPGIGRSATPQEIAAWDIDVRPDFKGLPSGSGSVTKGQEVWESKCASCHGVFGEANNVYSPLVGGTTADDIKTGRVARLRDPAFPGRTTLMKVSSVSTLWDYINRAMPWTQPKSLTPEEVYATTAFLLNLGGIVPDNFVLSDKNMAEVQARLPNRNGTSTAHALWPGNELGGSRSPDVKALPCMSDCAPLKGALRQAKVEPKQPAGASPQPVVASTLPVLASHYPDFALNSHGNLALQNRLVGAQRGLDTSRAGTRDGAAVSSAGGLSANAPQVLAQNPSGPPSLPALQVDSQAALTLANRHTCTACHAMDQRTVGPGFTEIAGKHAGKVDYLANKIRSGGSGVWGAIPMPAQAVSEADAKTLATWLAAGAGK